MLSSRKHVLLSKLFLTVLLPIFLLAGCGSTGAPKGIIPVANFELERYLGTWYEIARFDHKFERGLEQVSANYSLNTDGSVKVLNRGYSTSKSEWKEAVGKARFVKDSTTGHLKVSFFGPFYGSYIVFELDENNYEYAMVAGPDRSWLWILSRNPEIDPALYDSLLGIAADNGYDTSQLIRVKQ